MWKYRLLSEMVNLQIFQKNVAVCELVKMHLIVVFLTTFVNVIQCFDLSEVAFVVLSQPTERHVKISLETREKLASNLKEAGVVQPQVFDLQFHFPGNGGWTIFPLLEKVEKVSTSTTKWFIFLHETSEVNLEILKTILSKYESGITFN